MSESAIHKEGRGQAYSRKKLAHPLTEYDGDTDINEEYRKRMDAIEIDVHADVDQLPPFKKMLLQNMKEFAQRTSILFQDEMADIMHEYKEKNPAFTDEMRFRMSEKKYDLPHFSIYEGEYAEKFLSETNELSHAQLDPDGFLMVFNLPGPLGRFWYRGGTNSWGDGGEKIPENNIEWGHFYREIMPTIWSEVGYENTEGLLNINRVNSRSTHDSKKYYYVWQVVDQEER